MVFFETCFRNTFLEYVLKNKFYSRIYLLLENVLEISFQKYVLIVLSTVQPFKHENAFQWNSVCFSEFTFRKRSKKLHEIAATVSIEHILRCLCKSSQIILPTQ